MQPFREQAGGRPILVVNGDNDHYFKACCMKAFVPVEGRVASADGARRYLDALAAGGKVTHFFACAVGQRASFAAGVLRDGMNAVAFAREDAGAGRALWCEIDVTAPASGGKGWEKRSVEAAPSLSSVQTKYDRFN